nr:unnamed protein product [Digitaria exilis]
MAKRELDIVVPPCVLLLLSSTLLFSGAAAYSEYSCNGTTGNFTAGSAFATNLGLLVAALPANASSSPSLFATAGVGDAPDTAYGLALCRGDLTDPSACSSCLADAFSRLLRLCLDDRDATFYADLCTARYSGGDFLSNPGDNSPVIDALDVNASTYYGWDATNATSRTLFLSLVGTLLGEMSMYAAYNSSAARLFASAAMYVNPQLPTVYGFVQCTPDLTRAQCWECLQVIQDLNRRWYDGREGGRILGVRCSFRYEAYHFFAGMPEVRIGLKGDAPSSSAPGSHGSNHRKVLIVTLIVSITVFCAILVAGLLIIRAQRQRAVTRKKQQLQAQSRNSSATEEALKLGYMAPEYASEGIFSVKSDVYSFGVLLLEIVSGKRNSGHHHHYGDFVNLLGYAWQLWKDGRVCELIDPALGECGDAAAIVRCVKVALLCVQDSAADRPTMADVTAMLAAGNDAPSSALPDPRRPPHFSLRVKGGAGSSDDDDGGGSGLRTQTHGGTTSSFSTNDLTISSSIREGR